MAMHEKTRLSYRRPRRAFVVAASCSLFLVIGAPWVLGASWLQIALTYASLNAFMLNVLLVFLAVSLSLIEPGASANRLSFVTSNSLQTVGCSSGRNTEAKSHRPQTISSSFWAPEATRRRC